MALAFAIFAMASFADKEEPSTQLVIKISSGGVLRCRLNHKDRGNTPLTITDLPAGNYLIRASKDGFMGCF